MKRQLLLLTAIFTLTASTVLTAQITAGSIPTGMYAYNPYVNLSVAACNLHDSTSFDVNCDGIPDMAIDMYKGYTPIDGVVYALLYVLNDTFEICKDSGNFSNYYSTTGRPHYYNLGDTLNCPGNAQWEKDSIYALGDCCGWLISGPQVKNNTYIAYRKGSQIGWIQISFNLSDLSSCPYPVTVSITSLLAPCSGNAVSEIFSKDNFHITPNPFSTETVLQTDNSLRNATLSVDNCFGQTVRQIKNLSGQTVSLSRDNLPSGLYFVRLTEENKIIAVDKLVITNK